MMCVCACMWQPPPRHFTLSPPSLSLTLPLQYLSRSFFPVLTGETHAFCFSAWLLALLQHPSVPLVCSPPPLPAYVSPCGVCQPACFPGCCSSCCCCCFCCCWSSGAVSDTTLLRRYSSASLLLSAAFSPHTLLCRIITTESARDGDTEDEEGKGEREREACTLLHSTAAFFSFVFFLLLFLACFGVQAQGNNWSGENSLKEFILLSLRFLPSVHSWDRVQRRREEGGTGSRTCKLQKAQCPTLLQRHRRQTHKHLHRLDTVQADQTGRRGQIDTDRQEHRQTDRQTGGVMASVDSTGSSVSGRLRSGDLLHAGLVVALLLGELYFSLYPQLPCHSSLFH